MLRYNTESVLSVWDTKLLMVINVRLHHPAVMTLMGMITWLGDHRVVPVVAAVGAVVAWRRRRPEAGFRRDVVASLVGLSAALLMAGVLKGVIDRPRPAEVVNPLYVMPETILGAAFPSWHAAGAFGLAAVWSWVWPRGSAYWWGLAGLVALSRVYLGAHFPSDCLAGALLGMGLVYAMVWGVRWLEARLRLKNKEE